MSNWNYRINITRHLSELEDRDSMQKSFSGILDELKTLPPGLLNSPGVNRFKKDAQLAIEKEDVRIFNIGMDALYDWADEERIWTGLG